MSRVYIAGAGMTPFVSRAETAVRQLAQSAASAALADAGVTPAEVQRVYFGNAADGLLTGQEMIRGQVALRTSTLAGTAVINVENACASGSSAVLAAFDAVKAGRCDVALALGVEKLSNEDRHRTFAAIRGATDIGELDPADSQAVLTSSALLDVYAEEARDYLQNHDATVADFAAVAVKNRQHAALNPLAQYQKPQSVEDVLNSRMIADPLTLPMCSPTTDGAAAVVVVSESFRHRAGGPACEIKAIELTAGTGTGSAPVARAAHAAYNSAGLGPTDLDIIELHEAAAPSEVLQYAEIGLCAEGDGHYLIRCGATALGGTIPVNVSGGLLSRGHPLAATGCAQLVELFDQLTGRAGHRQVSGAAIGLAVNAGGWLGGTYATAVATILAAA
jgi:acetyl-CoA acetyltransferase